MSIKGKGREGLLELVNRSVLIIGVWGRGGLLELVNRGGLLELVNRSVLIMGVWGRGILLELVHISVLIMGCGGGKGCWSV